MFGGEGVEEEWEEGKIEVILDTRCNSSLCRLRFLAVIVASLCPSELEEMSVTQRPSEKRFIFQETE